MLHRNPSELITSEFCEFQTHETEEYIQIRKTEISLIKQCKQYPDRTEITLNNGKVIGVKMDYTATCEEVLL